MKSIRLITFLLMFFHWNTGYTKNMTIYDFSFEDIDGNSVDLNKFVGKPILMVNTASRCGFTPQYENLQNLFIHYKNTDLTILAITSNSFNQEYSSNEDIKKIIKPIMISEAFSPKTPSFHTSEKSSLKLLMTSIFYLSINYDYYYHEIH